MASGLYGQTIPANVKVEDVDIYYTYSETRSADASGNAIFRKLDSNILRQQITENPDNGVDTILEGMYKLNLPVNIFNKKGFYTIYIKPHEILATISDVSTLSDFPAVRGIVIRESDISNTNDRNLFTNNNALVGYRVIYLNTNNRSDISRIVTSNNKCEPLIKQAVGSSSSSTVYRYNNSSNDTFITLTPSLSNAGAPNVTPYIGSVGQKVLFVNTKFTPLAIDLELCDHDDETISIMLEGSQVLNNDTGRVTTFNEKGEIYHQAQTYTVKDDYTGQPIKTVKEHKTSDIDFNETISE